MSDNISDLKTNAQDLIEKHKIEDLEKLAKIKELIEEFNKLEPPYTDYFDKLQKMGEAASLIRFNDKRAGNKEYVRNKYGFVDRTEDGKHRYRESGIVFNKLSALIHLHKDEIQVNNETVNFLKKDFRIIDKKIDFAISNEENKTNLNSEGINKKLEELGNNQNFDKFIQYYYSKILINEISDILSNEDFKKELETLNLDTREDRYYIGRVLSIIGEMSKDFRDLFNPGGEAGLFSTFKNIRDDYLAHSKSALVRNLNDTQKKYFKFIIETLLMDKFKAKVENIKDYFLNPFDINKELEVNFIEEQDKIKINLNEYMKINLGNTTETEKQEINKIKDFVFSSQEKDQHIDIEVLKNIRVNELFKDDQPKWQAKTEEEKNRKLDKNVRNIGDKDNIDHDKYINLLKAKKEKYTELINSKKEKDKKLAEKIRIESIQMLEKVQPTQNNPKSVIEELEKAFGVQANKIEEILSNVSLRKTKPKSSLGIKKGGNEPTEKKSTNPDINKEKEKLKRNLEIISRELKYMMDIIRNNNISTHKKEFVANFSLTKIGQTFKDIEKEREIILSNVIHDDLKKSIINTTSARHKLMHDIISSKNLPISNILYRETLPMIPEIHAINTILQYLGEDGFDKLVDLGLSYYFLGHYGKALNYSMILYELLEDNESKNKEQRREINKKYCSLRNIDISSDEQDDLNNAKILKQIHEKINSKILNVKNGIQINNKETAKEYILLLNVNSLTTAILEKLVFKCHKDSENYLMKEFVELKILVHKFSIKLTKLLKKNFNISFLELQSTCYINLANTYRNNNEYEKALNSYRKILKKLDNEEENNPELQAFCLSNLGYTYYTPFINKFPNSVEIKEISSELAIKLMYGISFISESIEIYKKNNINDIVYYRTLSSLVQMCYNTFDQNIVLYGLSNYEDLKNMSQSLISRINSIEINSLTKLKEMADIMEDNFKPVIISKKFKPALEMNLEFLINLKILYFNMDICVKDVDSRIVEIRRKISKSKNLDDNKYYNRLEKTYEFAYKKFKDGNYDEALHYYNIALRSEIDMLNNLESIIEKEIITKYKNSTKTKKPVNQWNFEILLNIKIDNLEIENYLKDILNSQGIEVESSGNNKFFVELTSREAIEAMNNFVKNYDIEQGLGR